MEAGRGHRNSLSGVNTRVPDTARLGCELLYYAGGGQLDAIRQLHADHPALLEFKDYDARSALHLASAEGRYETVEWLLDNQCDANVLDRWGASPVHDAVRGGFLDVEALLVRRGAVPPDKSQARTRRICAFLSMAGEGDLPGMQRLQQEDPECLDYHDYDNRYALHVATSEGLVDAVKWLLDNGASVNVVDRWNGTPLEDAVRVGRKDIVALIHAHGGRLCEDGKLVRMHTLPARLCDACKKESFVFIK